MSSLSFGRAAAVSKGACASLLLIARGIRCRSRQWATFPHVAIVAMTVLLPAPAGAQGYAQPSGLGGFMQGLFGGPSQQPQYPQNPPLQVTPQGPVTHYPQSLHPRLLAPGRAVERSSGTTGKAQSQSEPPACSRRQPHSNASASLGGGLRTMCVRLCDGYYWPMTFDARRSRMDHDSKVCMASCSSEARAFVMPKSGEAKDMVDAQGRPYVKLANAFKYRKAQAGSCSCNPDPWDDEARARHDGFAEKSAAASAERAEKAEAEAANPAPGKGETKPKEQTMADAEAQILSGGTVAPGSGLAASAIVAQAPPVELAIPTIALIDEGKPKSKPLDNPVTVAARSVNSSEKKRSEARGSTKPDRPPVVVTRPTTPSMPYPPGRIIVPAGYARQPYVIGQPQGVPYRTY